MEGLELLQETLKEAARSVAGEQADAVLEAMGADVARTLAEPLTIFPVAHHSPASAVHMVRWLRENRPKVIFIELPEDLDRHLPDLADCTLPVALQAFTSEPEDLPREWAPLSIVAPLTELSAELQAIAAAQELQIPLVFVDRSVDHVFQFRRDHEEALDALDPLAEDQEPAQNQVALRAPEDDHARMHGQAVGVEVGALPAFGAFAEALLLNARMSHFHEWWSLYVEQPALAADTETYRQLYTLVGSLFRRLGSEPVRQEENRWRERFMWTRMKRWLAEHHVDPSDAVYLCGALHAVSDVPEFGTGTDAVWEDLPPPTPTVWRYGLIPSSHAAIEWQFGHPRGALTLAESTWKRALKTWRIAPFRFKPAKGRSRAALPPDPIDVRAVLTEPPALQDHDDDELLDWCTRIVALARKHRYLATTADSIAIYQTALLLARLRARKRPSPWDFVDAAETCLEKSTVPGRRNVRQLCGQMLGGERVGQVGYDALPPLVQDVYDRLAPVGITAQTRTVKRVLMDFDKAPDLRAASDLLWRLHALIAGRAVRPIMGERVLGGQPRQESWDVKLAGPEQRAVIQLSFEGITVEQVLEKRLNEAAFAEGAGPVNALEATEQSLLLLDSPRLTRALGERSVALLTQDRSAADAAEVFARVRRLVAYFRARPEGLPPWLSELVAQGYRHYTSLLPEAFQDRNVAPEAVGAMLAFIFNLEGLALSMGCDRAQLLIAVSQAGPLTVDAEKLGLLWTVEWLLALRDLDEVRAAFASILHNPMSRDAVPRYLAGHLLGIQLSARVAPVAVDLLGRAFGALPDRVLMGWLPGLITALRPHAGTVLPSLFQELARVLPPDLAGVDGWQAPWSQEIPVSSPAEGAAAETSTGAPLPLLAAFPAALEAHAGALGLELTWATGAPDTPDSAGPATALLARHPAAVQAWSALLAGAVGPER